MGRHEEGIAKADAWCDEHNVPFNELRWIAADHLCQRMRDELGPDHGHGIGSSDVSIHLSSLALWEPEALFGKAQPLTLIGRSARSQGISFEQCKAQFAMLFAPIEDEPVCP